MASNAVIRGSPEGDFYGSHAMYRLRYSREENAERRIFCCAASRSGPGVDSIAPKNKAFHAIFVALPLIETRE